MARGWKIGEMANRCGLSVRALHHYDAIGLFRPSARSGAGHRVYSEADVTRLGQITSLRALGLSLAEVRRFLDRRECSPLRVVEMHLERLDEQVHQLETLRSRLRLLAHRFRAAEAVSAEEIFNAIEEMTMVEKYYTPEQLEYLAKRREEVGDARIHEVEAEWPILMAEVRAAIDAGVDPKSEPARALATHWMGLVREFTGSNPGITKSLGNLYKGESTVQGMDVAPMHELMTFIRQASDEGACP
jgi:DNA-binding transcriptional MerR regulator